MPLSHSTRSPTPPASLVAAVESSPHTPHHPPSPMAPFLLLLLLAHTLSSAAAPTPRPVADAPASAPPTSPPSTPSPPGAPSPSDLTGIMARKGCKSFAGLLNANPDALTAFEGVVNGGLTVFCPPDHAVSSFMPQYKNLSAAGKMSLLLYHGVPYYNSLSTLKTSNGVVNTLATEGVSKNYNVTVQDDGDKVSLKTGVATASITGTAFDDKQYLAIFTISDVLQPPELFKIDEPDSPSPTPAAAPKKKKKAPTKEAPPPADSPDASPADDKAADDASNIIWSSTAQWAVAVATAIVGIVMA